MRYNAAFAGDRGWIKGPRFTGKLRGARSIPPARKQKTIVSGNTDDFTFEGETKHRKYSPDTFFQLEERRAQGDVADVADCVT